MGHPVYVHINLHGLGVIKHFIPYFDGVIKGVIYRLEYYLLPCFSGLGNKMLNSHKGAETGAINTLLLYTH